MQRDSAGIWTPRMMVPPALKVETVPSFNRDPEEVAATDAAIRADSAGNFRRGARWRDVASTNALPARPRRTRRQGWRLALVGDFWVAVKRTIERRTRRRIQPARVSVRFWREPWANAQCRLLWHQRCQILCGSRASRPLVFGNPSRAGRPRTDLGTQRRWHWANAQRLIFSQPRNARAGLWICLLACVCAAAAPTWADDTSLKQADHLRLTGRYEEADELYQQLGPQHFELAARGRARCLAAIGERPRARQLLQTAIEERPQSALLLAEAAWLAFRSGEHEPAQSLADRAIRVDAKQLQARWVVAELHRTAGRLEQANQAYGWFVNEFPRPERLADAEAVLWVGRAAAEHARWNRNSRKFDFLVNTLFPRAIELDEDFWPARFEAGQIFLEKYNEPDAASELNAAIKINPRAASVHVALGQLALQNLQLDRARIALERALAVNPHLKEALQLKADWLMASFQTTKAIDVLHEAVKQNPLDEATLGRLAAAYGKLDRDPDRDSDTDTDGDSRLTKLVRAVLARNPHCGEFYASAADSYDLMRLYPQAAGYYEQAIGRMPQLVAPYGKLGLIYMRLAEETKAAKLLNEAFEIDPFNVRVKNTLEVLDLLAGYAVLETDHFIIKFDRGQDEILARFAARYLEQTVYPEITTKLGHKPREKTLLEIFSRAQGTSGHGWFSARMVGLPTIGTVGACAGKMFALTSPSELSGFNWARVLRHEFVHVVNLQQTNFHIPHWFTEALAVHNEGFALPSEWPPLLARRVLEDRLFDLSSINLGFVRPASGDDWSLAYYQAYLYAQFMRDSFGADSLDKMLAAYASQSSTECAIRDVFGIEVDEFERRYRTFLDQIVAEQGSATEPLEKPISQLQREAADQPQDAAAQARLAEAYLDRRDSVRARQLADRACELEPGQPLANCVLARLYVSIGDVDRAKRLLQDCLDERQPDTKVLALLAGLQLKLKDYKEAQRLYQLGADRYPQDLVWTKGLARVLLHSQDESKLAAALEKIALQEHEDAAFSKKLTQLALKRRDFVEAERWANRALQVDVQDATMHAQLAEGLAGQGRASEAAEAYATALQIQPDQTSWRIALAEVQIKAGQKEQARRTLHDILRRVPDHSAATQLLEQL